jgi:transposase
MFIIVIGIPITVATRRRKVGNATYLEEYRSHRVNGKVVTKFVRYIGKEDSGNKVVESSRIIDRLVPAGSRRAGDVDLLWSIAQNLEIPGIIDRMCHPGSSISPGKVLTAWAINRVVDPESATQLEQWVKTTDLPRLSGIPEDWWTKDLFLDSLDAICYDQRRTQELKDLTRNIDEEIFRHWRTKHPLNGKDHVAYDLTTLLLFGTSCPLAEFGYNPNHENRRQINIALMVSKEDYQPEYHAVFNGSRSGSTTIRNLITALPRNNDEHPGTIIWDRGNISEKNVKELEATGWFLISGIPKSVKQIHDILSHTEIKQRPDNHVRKANTAHIYADLVHENIYGKNRNIAVYVNPLKALNESDERNSELSDIAKKLDILSRECKDWNESSIHREMSRITGRWKQYFDVKIKRNGSSRIEWRYHSHALAAAERLDGRSAILCTDPDLSASDIVNMYLEKDFVEKAFRTMKTQEEVVPVRHRLERRVRAYVFVMVTAYRLIAALVYAIRESGDRDPWEKSQDLIRYLSRVERTEITLGKERKIWFLNTRREEVELLKKLGYGELFDEKQQKNSV